MRAVIFGRGSEHILPLVNKYGFEVVEQDPDIVFSYGGDGSVILSEFAFPGILKAILKNSAVCKMCSPLDNETVLARISSGVYHTREIHKLKATAHTQQFYALNDIVIHNQDPRHAIRYRIRVNGKELGHEIIGDGVVLATPFGSTAYYRSITDSFFEIGIGVAFNNSTEQADHMVLREDVRIELTITRGPAVLYADNQQEYAVLSDGDTVTIQQASQVARLVVV